MGLLFLLAAFPGSLFAQELHQDEQGLFRGRVIEVISREERQVPGTETSHIFQSIRAEILEGSRKGEVVVIENDYFELDEGDKFYFSHLVDISGREMYEIVNVDRRGALAGLALVFVLAVVLFGGWQGVRSLVALLGSFLAIFYILLPGLLNGWNPILAGSLVAGGILFAAIFFTHGFNRESVVAYGGTMLAVLITGVFAAFSVDIANLSGFYSDESVYLNFSTSGTLDFTALLLGAIIIGILGVLDDIAATQAAVVSEFYAHDPDMTKTQAYTRAIRVGREHVGALVNTLVLAYTGAALPLLLYFQTATANVGTLVNLEVIATEIVRIIVGSVGLVLTVPIVTALAVVFLKGAKNSGAHTHHAHHRLES